MADKRPSHYAVPGRVVYPRFPGFNLSADKFARLARPNATGLSGLLWYGAENGDACIYSPSGAFAPKIDGVAPSDSEINGCIHWGSSIYRSTDGTWVYVYDAGLPACNPFEAWHFVEDPDDPDADPIKVYDGWGWWTLTIPSTYDFSSSAGNAITLVPHGTLLNENRRTIRENPPDLELEWDAYRRVEKPSDEVGPGGLYRNEDGDEVSVGNPAWDAEDPALSRLVGVRTKDGGMRYVADGVDAVNLSGGRPMITYGAKHYMAHEKPKPKQSIRFEPCTARGEAIEPDQWNQPFTAAWHGFMTAVTPRAIVRAFELPTVINDAGEDA